MRVGPLGCDTWESPHRNGAKGTALSEKARGCDRGQALCVSNECPQGLWCQRGVCQGNGTLHKGTQTNMALPPFPSPEKESAGEGDAGGWGV